MKKSVRLAPQILSTLIRDPDLIYSTTCEHLQKLTDHILAESIANLRFISDILYIIYIYSFHILLSFLTCSHMDLAYSGGGHGGVNVDLKYGNYLSFLFSFYQINITFV